MPEENSETNRLDEDEMDVDLDIPTYLRGGVITPQRQKVEERLSPEEIRAVADAAPDAKPRAKEIQHPLDQYDFDELGKPCIKAMVIHLREDGEVGFVSPHVPEGPPNTKESLRRFFDEKFKYAQINQFFTFLMGGEWHMINSKGDILPIKKEELNKMWREAMERKKKMQ